MAEPNVEVTNPDSVQIPGFTVRPPGVPDPDINTANPKPDTGVTLDPGINARTLPSPATATARSYMMNFGLGHVLGQSADELNQQLTSGQEKDIRTQAAYSLDANQIKLKQDQLKNIIMGSTGPVDYQKLKGVFDSHPEATDPDTVAERAYGQEYVNALEVASQNNEGNEYSDAQQKYPEQTERIKREGGELIGRREYAVSLFQDVQDDMEKQSTIGYLADWAKEMVPFYNEAKLRGWMGNTSYFAGGALGNNLDEQSTNLLMMPIGQYKENLLRIVSALRKDNPQAAAHFLGAVIGQSTTDKFLDNFMSVMNVTAVPGAGMVGRGLAGALGAKTVLEKATEKAAEEGTKAAVKDVVKSVKFGTTAPELKDIPVGWWAEKEPNSDVWFLRTKSASADGAGDLEAAGVKKATADTISAKIDPKAPQREAIEALPSSMRVDQDAFDQAPGAGGQNIANRIRAKMESLISDFNDTVMRIRRVDRIPEVMASEAAIKLIKDDIKQNFRGLPDSISDVVGPHYDPYSNSYNFDLHITQPDGTLFKTKIQAQGYAKLSGLLDAKVEPVMTDTKFSKYGMGWKVITSMPLNEDSKVVRDLIGKTAESKLQETKFDGWINATIGRWRTPKEVLSIEENMQREKATHSPAVLLGLLHRSAKELESIPKGLPFTKTRERWNQWNRALDYSRKAYDPVTKDPGWFFDNGQQLDDFYQRNFDRLPSDLEKEAYFAAKRNVELDRVFRTMKEFQNKSIWGAQQHRIFGYDAEGKRFDSAFLEGRIIKDLPHTEDTIYVQQGKGEGKLYRGNDPHYFNLRKILVPKVMKGEMKAIETWNPELRPLQTFGKNARDARVRYIISDKVETKGLDWSSQVNRRGGGHFVYDYNYYIKQAKVRAENVAGRVKHWYEGDTTVFPVNIRALGEDVIKHMNAVRLLLKDGKIDEAEAYHTKSPLPFDWKTHREWYHEQKDPRGVKHPARLNYNEPFMVVPKNKTVADLDNSMAARYTNAQGKSTFKDGTREGNPARQHMEEFTGPRDAHEVYTINDYGTRGNPLYKYEPAKLVDPIPTMNKAMNGIVKGMFNDDMKAFSVNHWLKEAAPYLKVDGGLNTLFHSPFYYFHHSKDLWEEGATQKDKNLINTLKASQFMIKQFDGIPNTTETAIHSITQIMADALYRKAGPKVVPNWMLTQVKDPAAYVRSMVVHMKLGLFNLPSFFVQASTFVNVLGMAGAEHAMPGAAGALLHSWARINRDPAILKKLDEYASKLGHKPGHWLEANEELVNRGFTNVGHEHALTDAPYTNKVITSKWGAMLDAGQVFFREGASSIRSAAWYTAHHEWRVENPTGKLSTRDWDRIHARASDLDHNMSRAANSQLQSGIMSFPMQFATYSVRLMELMTGKRLTPYEKARLFVTSSIMYGLPLGGFGLMGFPAGEYIKKSAQDGGYVIGDHFVNDVIQNGLPSAAIQAITGNSYDIAERWGIGGIDPLKEAVLSDEPMWKVIGGAASSTFANTFDNASGIFKAGASFISGRQSDFPVTTDDVLDIFNEISTFNDTRRMLVALNTGNWVSKNGTVLDTNISRVNAVGMAALGLAPSRVANLHNTYELEQEQKATYKWAEGKAIKELRRMFQSKADNDPEQADKYLIRAKAYMDSVGFPEQMRTQVITAAAKGHESLIDITERSYLTKNVPQGQEQKRLETYRKLQGNQ